MRPTIAVVALSALALLSYQRFVRRSGSPAAMPVPAAPARTPSAPGEPEAAAPAAPVETPAPAVNPPSFDKKAESVSGVAAGAANERLTKASADRLAEYVKQRMAREYKPPVASSNPILVVQAVPLDEKSDKEFHASWLYNKGLAEYASGDLKSASKDWKDAARLEPGNEKVKNALKRIKKEMSAGEAP